MINLVVKHAGKKYNVSLEDESSGLEFKTKMAQLTGVPTERQKILVKGGQIKDETKVASLGLAPGAALMMLGTAGALPSKPANVELFVASEEKVDPEPNGLVNIGNTCYAASTIQALRALGDVEAALRGYSGDSQLLKALGSLMKQLDTQAVSPIVFMLSLRAAVPQFDERDQQSGLYKQQDAEELWTQLLETIRQAGIKSAAGVPLDRYFEGMFETRLVNTENEQEAATERAEAWNKLGCHISITTNFMLDGLQSGLSEGIEKNSETLGRNAQYQLTKQISRLPKYLTVQMVRFFWRRDTREKSKILRKVAFPFKLDVTEMCTPELRKKLVPARDALREMDNEFEDARRIARRQRYSQLNDKKDKIEDTLPLEKQQELATMVKSKIDQELGEDLSANPFGVYELSAVITHRGQSADSGHYIAFVKNKKENDSWWCFNDDKTSRVDDARIEQLAGGGESDSALILLYSTPSLDMGDKV